MRPRNHVVFLFVPESPLMLYVTGYHEAGRPPGGLPASSTIGAGWWGISVTGMPLVWGIRWRAAAHDA